MSLNIQLKYGSEDITTLDTINTEAILTTQNSYCNQDINIKLNVDEYNSEYEARRLIGGKIFYIHNDNEATYRFFDINGNELTTLTIEGLATAYYYLVDTIPSVDKFYVLNTKVGNAGLSNTYKWSTSLKKELGTKNYNYIGGGKLASRCIDNATYEDVDSIWHWLKYRVNYDTNVTGCTDWYIGSSPNIFLGDESTTELGKLHYAIITYPSLFIDQRLWFSNHNLWSSIEHLDSSVIQAISWDYERSTWYFNTKSTRNAACAIRSF